MSKQVVDKTLSFARFATNIPRWNLIERKMSFVHVRKIGGEERIQLTFKVGDIGKNGNGRVFNMDRLQGEEVEKTLTRIQTNVSKVLNKKLRKKKQKQDEATGTTQDTVEPNINLLSRSGEVVQGSTLNSETWEEGGVLEINDQKLNIRVNVPLVKKLNLPNCIMAGYNVFPNIDAEFIDLSHCRFVWFKEMVEARSQIESKIPENTSNDEQPICAENKSWIQVGKGLSYMPVNADISQRLRLECTPGDGKQEGHTKDVISDCPVTPGPGFCPFERRHMETQELAGPGSFRMVTYNILADTYADSDFSRDYLFPYCPTYALEQDYRKQLLFKELSGYNSDIVCLQEVDRRLFVSDLLPWMEQLGFEGFLRMKYGQMREGAATFYRKSKFRLIGEHDISLTASLKEDPLYDDIWQKICSSEGLKSLMEERSTGCQVTVLESIEDQKKLVVGTSHFYFHPKADHIRLLQTVICLRHLDFVAKKYTAEGKEDPAVVFCGDLNSSPGCGVHHFIKNKHIPSNHVDWYSGGKVEFAENMEFRHDLDLECASGFPRYTNFVTSFSGCLDYIYVDKTKLKTTKIVSMPTHDEVTQYTALPNVVFPSDHLAVICDIAWT